MHCFLVSAAHKSSGKTTISIGLCAALAQRGCTVQPFKKGPDYIDPLWLSQAAGRPCYNLDLYLSTTGEIEQTFAARAHAADVCVVEGNKGLYDGLSLDGSNSNAALATTLDLPVILVIDSRGMTRGIAPLILGYQAFDRNIRIAGVILNRVGGARHEAKLRAVIEHYTQVPVIGAIPENPDLEIPERHLGLVPSNEDGNATEHIARLGRAIGEFVDLNRLLELTAVTKTPAATPAVSLFPKLPKRASRRKSTPPDLRIGIARDAAFGFYYPEDLQAIRAAGAELVPFDTLRDSALPAVDGVFIGGGFPEVLAEGLAANHGLREQLRREIEQGLPVYAECGGLMYLTRSIEWQGKTHAMVGAIEADTVLHRKPVGRGYVELRATADHPWPISAAAGHPDAGGLIRAHEFHYSSLENIGPDLRYAWQVRRGHGIDGKHDGILRHNVLAAYCHLRAVAGSSWPEHFVDFVRRCSAARCAVRATGTGG